MSEPLVSFIVPTKNAARTIEACLESLGAQTHGRTEVIVVDNFSTDGTREIAEGHADITVSSGPERSAQRNHGAALSCGNVLVFIDADMVLEPQVATECAAAFDADRSVGGLVIPEVSFGHGYFARCRALEKELYLGDDRVEAARAFRRDVFDGSGGYSEILNAFEDWDLADRVRVGGWSIGRVDARIHHDDGIVSPRSQFIKKRYYGRGSSQYLAGKQTQRKRSLWRTNFLRHPGLLIRRPDRAIGLLFLKSIEAAGIAVGVYEGRRADSLTKATDLALTDVTAFRVLHVIGEFSRAEGIGRSITELVDRCPGEHHLLTAVFISGEEHFASIHVVGGTRSAFPIFRRRRVKRIVKQLNPDVVHFHGGPLVSLLTPLRVWNGPKKVASIYRWPLLPQLALVRKISWRSTFLAQVVKPRIVVSTIIPSRVFESLLRLGGITSVLTPDPAVVSNLPRTNTKLVGVAGASPDKRRARLNPEHPTIVFAGRAEAIRGIDTLLDAVPLVMKRVPNLSVRLLLLASPESDAMRASIQARELTETVSVTTEPRVDLQDDFASASVAVFPFLFDHVTLPPALTVSEALAVGLPVVGTDVVCITAILRDGVNGRVVPVGDVNALADAITAIISSEDTWRKLSDGAIRTIATTDSWDSVAIAAAAAYGISGTLPMQTKTEMEGPPA